MGRKVRVLTTCACGIRFRAGPAAHLCPGCRKKRRRAGQSKCIEQRSMPTCPRCGQHRISSGREICWECWHAEKVPVTCPTCGEVRTVTRGHERGRTFKPLCAHCRGVPRGDRLQLWRESVTPTPRQLKINGCTIVPVLRGRCADYERCMFGMYCDAFGLEGTASDCAYQVACLNYTGFTCLPESTPNLITDEMWDEIRRREIGNQREYSIFEQTVDIMRMY